MSFDGFDIDKMFEEAAGAAENTGEKAPEGYSKNPKKSSDEPSFEVKQEDKPKKEEPKKEEPKKEIPKQSEPKKEEKETPKKEKLGPLIKSNGKTNISDGLNVEIINKVLEMNSILENYNSTELKFVKGYFQDENGDSGDIIYKALITDTRGLDALDKIVTARGHTAAERAFYLMELDNNSIESIYEQVDLLTGELDESTHVTEINKIKVCKILEKTISQMPNDVFTYINKLQEFTNKAIS